MGCQLIKMSTAANLVLFLNGITDIWLQSNRIHIYIPVSARYEKTAEHQEMFLVFKN